MGNPSCNGRLIDELLVSEVVALREMPGRRYWLLKSEPDPHVKLGVDLSYPFERLSTEPSETGIYTGVRNHQARNYIRDQMNAGDLCFFYHSSCKVPGIAGIVEIARDPTPDEDAKVKGHPMYDEKHTKLSPRWFSVAVKKVRPMHPFVTLTLLRENEERLKTMALLRQPRLSVQPVTKEEWDAIIEIETAAATGSATTSTRSSSGSSSKVGSSSSNSKKEAVSSGSAAAPTVPLSGSKRPAGGKSEETERKKRKFSSTSIR